MNDKIYDINTKISLRDIINARKNKECWTCVYGEQISNDTPSMVYCRMKKEYILKEPIQLCLFYDIKNFNQK